MAALSCALLILQLVHCVVSFNLFTIILFSVASFPLDDSAVNEKSVCPKEILTLYCPAIEQAIHSGNYKELFWQVVDPRNKSLRVRNIGYCDENLNCTRYNSLGNYEKRIFIKSDPVKGVLHVEQLMKNDLLTFMCYVERKGNIRDPVFYGVNISSITCKYD